MMRKILCLYVLIFGMLVFGQGNSESLRDMPDFIPPSPTVNSLMKFEEFPVSYYTGIPEISIPIYKEDIGLKNVALTVSLNYHPSNAELKDKASEVGLGWSLLAGGTISRTVRGSPDEKLATYTNGSKKKRGIYLDENTNVDVYKNYFKKIIDSEPLATNLYNKSFFEAYYLNNYDTQYDLYQYNFLNYVGRFVIKKEGSELKIKKLDKNNLKIQLFYDQSTLEPLSFTITDDNGNIFEFDVLEKSSTETFSDSDDYWSSPSYTTSSRMNVKFNSAYHLSKIKDSELHTKVLLKYTAPTEITYTDNSSINRTFYIPNPNLAYFNQNKSILPRVREINSFKTYTDVRKLYEIEIVDKAKILLEYSGNREDTNWGDGVDVSVLSKLSKISIANFNSNIVRSFNFNYSYYFQNDNNKKLFLTKIQNLKRDNSIDNDYTFSYYFSPFVQTNDFCSGNDAIKNGLLEKIEYPTKGKAQFTFEPHTYSYVPNDMVDAPTPSKKLTNFDDNYLNWTCANNMVVFNNFNSNQKYAFTLNNPSTVDLYINTSMIDQYPWTLNVYNSSGWVTGFGTEIGSLPSQLSLPAGEYYFRLTSQSGGTSSLVFNATFNCFYKTKNTNDFKFLFGEGCRIQKIDYYTTQSDFRTIKYDYNEIDDIKRSSGALIYPIIHNYTEYYKALLESTHLCFQPCTYLFETDISYFNPQDNFVPAQKEKGDNIGYKTITVSETGKGKTIYTFTSPIDYPNSEFYPSLPPFYKVPNYDFKRGNLLNKKTFNHNNILLTEKIMQYDFVESFINLGFTINTFSASPVGHYLYGGKNTSWEGFANDNIGAAGLLNGDVSQILIYDRDREVIGKAYLKKEENIDYLSASSPTKNTTEFVYNSLDYPSEKKITFSNGAQEKTYFKYAHEKGNQKLINANMIGIPLETLVTKKIDSLDSEKIISHLETLYGNVNHKFPTSLRKFNLQIPTTLSEEITYDRYDSKGNLLQYTTKNGITTFIIWGYNQTLPIAKLEGLDYEVPIDDYAVSIINASNSDATAIPNNDEATLLKALDKFRKKTELSGYQITTYTYDPLIGVRSITPPSGIREYYFYDTANRLEKIVDINGKILKEFKYNYKQ